jgi:L-rhamnose-H+ transport protein
MFWMVLIIVGGVLTGSFALPMKYTTRWKWEHTWAMFSIWTLLVIPWIAGFLSVPHLLTVFARAGTAAVLTVFILGCLWGISSVAFGFGIHRLGLGLGYSLMMGMIISLGALIPLFGSGGNELSTASLAAVFGGVAVILLGVCLSGWAAVARQHDQAPTKKESLGPARKSDLAVGLLVCAIAGVTAPMLNLAFVYGDTIRAHAVQLGASRTLAPNAVWAVTLLGGCVVNLTYTLSLVHKRQSWRVFVEPGTGIYFFYTLLMGLLWAASIITYGMAAANLGELGASAGWAAFNATGILWANCLGLLTKEWKGVGRKGRLIMNTGLAVLLAGVLLIGLAKAL